MSKKSLGDYLVETGIEYILMFVGLCLLAIPAAIMMGGLTGAAGLIFIVVIFALCLLSGSKEQSLEEEKKLEEERLQEQRLRELYTKTCPNCGVALRKKLKKCPKCGYKFKK